MQLPYQKADRRRSPASFLRTFRCSLEDLEKWRSAGEVPPFWRLGRAPEKCHPLGGRRGATLLVEPGARGKPFTRVASKDAAEVLLGGARCPEKCHPLGESLGEEKCHRGEVPPSWRPPPREVPPSEALPGQCHPLGRARPGARWRGLGCFAWRHPGNLLRSLDSASG